MKTGQFTICRALSAVIFTTIFIALGASTPRTLYRATLDCPRNHSKFVDGSVTIDKTVKVDRNVVMLDEVFLHCAPKYTFEGEDSLDTISLFFIIDHSGSMVDMDPNAGRYDVVKALIDSLYRRSPASEVGLAVFSNKLMHNFNDNAAFKVLESSQAKGWNDSYVPLTRLDSQSGGMSAVDLLKWAIELHPTQDDGTVYKQRKLVNANYGSAGSGRREYVGGTDISIAFDAAVEAFRSSKYRKERQFLIFLSDGEHQQIDDAREADSVKYIDGQDIPTTLTAYFIIPGVAVPSQIRKMTENIKNNGYSKTNIYSNVWTHQTTATDLLSKILKEVVGGGYKKKTSYWKNVMINGEEADYFDSLYAFYDAPFMPLDKSGKVKLEISQTFHWNKPWDTDSTENFSVTVEHGSYPYDVEAAKGWKQGVLAFYYSGSELTVAQPDKLVLDIRYYQPDTVTAPPLTEPVQLTITNGAGTDSVVLNLTKDSFGTYYYGSFAREYADIKTYDNIIQNSSSDKLIAIYRNPKIPLDTIAYSIPVGDLVDMGLKSAYYLDEDANGHPDKIVAVQAQQPSLSADECTLVKEYMKVKSPRHIKYLETVSPWASGFSITFPAIAGSTGLNTSLYSGENLEIRKVPLPSGQIFPFTDIAIADSMAPVVVSGVYCPGFIKKEGQTVLDTLIVNFSENVPTPQNIRPFKFYDAGAGSREITMTLEYLENVESDAQSFLVKAITTSDNLPWYPAAGDSLWIDHTTGVCDLLRNVQENAANRKGPLTVRPFQFNLTVTAFPNPITLQDLGLVFPISGTTSQQSGMVILAKIIGSVPQNVTFNGTMVVYDCVGNYVERLEAEYVDTDNNGIKETGVFVWDGTNSFGRKVGYGGYLGVVNVQSSEGQVKAQTIMLGIKWTENAAAEN